jgi:hypothetical protein
MLAAWPRTFAETDWCGDYSTNSDFHGRRTIADQNSWDAWRAVREAKKEAAAVKAAADRKAAKEAEEAAK